MSQPGSTLRARATWTGILAFATCTGCACAQDAGAQWLADLTIAPDHVDIVLRLSMYSPEPWEGLAQIHFDVLNQLGADYGGITEFQILNNLDYLSGPTTINDGDSLLDTLLTQAWWHFQFTPDNPIDVIAFRWEPEPGYTIADDGLAVEYATAIVERGFETAIWAGPDNDDDAIYGIDISDSLEEVTFGWSVVPAPATALGLVGALTLRRRRRA